MFGDDNHLSTKELREGLNALTELKSNSDEMIHDLQLYSQNMMEIQQQNACDLISSQDRIAEKVDTSNRFLSKIEYGMYDLQAAFDWHLTKVSWQLEQSNSALQTLVSNCYKVIENRALEYRNRGENAYKNRWVDDSLKEFLIAEKLNVYDFTIHMFLGIIYLEDKHDLPKALEYFEKSAHYAKPVSALYHSQALIYQAKIYIDLHNLSKAYSFAKLAYETKTDFTEAMYMYAICSVFVNDTKTAIEMLEKAIRINVDYCEKCYYDKDFLPIKKDIEELFSRLLKEQKDKISQSYPSKAEKATYLFHILSKEIPEIPESDLELRQKCYKLEALLNRIDTLIKRNSYRDLLEANEKIVQLPAPITDIASHSIRLQKSKITMLERDIVIIESSNKKLYSDWLERKKKWDDKLTKELNEIGCGWGLFGGIGGFLLGFTTCTINMTNTNGDSGEIGNNFLIWLYTWVVCCVIAIIGSFIHKKFIKKDNPYNIEPTYSDSYKEKNLINKYTDTISKIVALNNTI